MNSTWREAFLQAIEIASDLELAKNTAVIDFIEEFGFHRFCVLGNQIRALCSPGYTVSFLPHCVI